MVPPAAATWLPVALACAVPLAVLGLVWLRRAWSRGEPDEDSDSDGGPGGPRRPDPEGPLPSGPVSWPDFEREFAAYAERRTRRGPAAGAPAAPDRGSVRPRARARAAR
jgi:hypothetical protein